MRTLPISQGVAERYDLSGVKTLVDVGAGRGHTLAAVLRANPELRGVLFDRPPVVAHAKESFEEWGLSDRTDFIAGDFFQSVPAGHDAYLLGSVIHNWDDADAERILRNVREAMDDSGRVLLTELIIPEDDSPHIGKELDMRMLGLFGQGRERTRSEYSTLLEKAGLQLTGTIDLPEYGNLIEAKAH
jgi:cyclopropane fatty-acyl-phospholipid synthase-like methyltransferase